MGAFLYYAFDSSAHGVHVPVRGDVAEAHATAFGARMPSPIAWNIQEPSAGKRVHIYGHTAAWAFDSVQFPIMQAWTWGHGMLHV